jgi:hypothetical protein
MPPIKIMHSKMEKFNSTVFMLSKANILGLLFKREIMNV